jgi:2-keto-4-pentenoate hydratase/2-oxohepta-3-ene-1,7-dioic acid hydratase in catechol pathway
VIFTKRSTSIIASGEDIYPHPEFTQTLDYEGEIGVIIGKAAFQIKERDAMDYVWGYTIINGWSQSFTLFENNTQANSPQNRCHRPREAT